MLHTLRSRITYANVVATLALFVAVGTGGAYAANTVFSTDIVDGQVKSVDVGNNEIGSSDVKDNSLNTFDVHSFLGVDVVDGTLASEDVANDSLTGDDVIEDSFAIGTNAIADGSLHDVDIAQSAFVNFTASIGAMSPGTCTLGELTGIDAQADHLVLTPNYETARPSITTYGIVYRTGATSAYLQACNPTATAQTPDTANFNLLVIDAE